MTTETTPPASAPVPAPEPKRSGGGLRVLKWIVLLLIVVIVVGAVAVYVYLDSIVKSVVVKQSTNSLNQQTSLDAAHVSLFGGNVKLSNFQVSSPTGYKAPQMMSLGGLDVKASLGELRSDPVKVSQITIKDPKLVIEMAGTKFNIKQFMDALPAGEDKPTPDGQKPLKLIINDLNVQGAQVIFRPDVAALSAVPGIGSNLGGLKQEYVLTIPPLDLQNIGTGEGSQNGAAVKEVVSLLITKLAAQAAQSDQLPPELRQVLSLNVNDITNMVKAKIGAQVDKQLGKVTEELNKKLPGAATQAIGGILNNPQGATTQPGEAIQKGLGGLLDQATQKKEKKK